MKLNKHTVGCGGWPGAARAQCAARAFILSLTLFSSLPGFAQDKPTGGDIEIDPKSATIKWRLGLMPILSFYVITTDNLDALQPTQGLGISTRAEFKFNPNSTTKLLVGIDYMNEGVKFDSYYFPAGSSPIYDKNFNYTHHLHIHELYIPILFKQGFNDEDRKRNSMYLSGGWAFRYMMGTSFKITSKTDGSTVDKGFSPLSVEHKFLTENSGSSLIGGLGFEHKMPGMRKAVFLESYFHYNLSRIYYTGNNGTNKIKFRNHSVTITVGYEF
jgi:hypothetical protein